MSSSELVRPGSTKERFKRTKQFIKRLPHAAFITAYLGGFGTAGLNYYHKESYQDLYEKTLKSSQADGNIDQNESKKLEEIKEKINNAERLAIAGLKAGILGGAVIYIAGALYLRKEIKQEARNGHVFAHK